MLLHHILSLSLFLSLAFSICHIICGCTFHTLVFWNESLEIIEVRVHNMYESLHLCTCARSLFDKELLSGFGHALKTLSAAGERELHTEDQPSFLFLSTPLMSFPSITLCIFINPTSLFCPLSLLWVLLFFSVQSPKMETREFQTWWIDSHWSNSLYQKKEEEGQLLKWF